MEEIWQSVKKSEDMSEKQFSDVFISKCAKISHKKHKQAEYQEDCKRLKKRFTPNTSDFIMRKLDRSSKVKIQEEFDNLEDFWNRVSKCENFQSIGEISRDINTFKLQQQLQHEIVDRFKSLGELLNESKEYDPELES